MLLASTGIPNSTDNLTVKVPIDTRARNVILPDNWEFYQHVRIDPRFLRSSMATLASWPRLESIMIWPQCPPRDSWHVSPAAGTTADRHHWPQKTIDSVFGNEHIRLVNLRDNADVHGIVAQLVSGNIRHDLAQIILRARDLYQGNMDWRPNYWAEAVRLCQQGWLLGKFQAATAVPHAQHGYGAQSSDIPIDISLNDHQFDREDPWIEKMLAQMPQPQPVFLLARDDTGAFLVGNSRKRKWFEALLTYKYDDESRLFKRAQWG